MIEALPPAGRAELDAALADLGALVAQHCGGTVRTGVLDRGKATFPLD